MKEINLHNTYWIFATYTYYPEGGLDDIVYTTDSLEDAQDWIMKSQQKHTYDHYSLFDSINKKEI